MFQCVQMDTLTDGSCFEYKRSGFYDVKESNVEINSDELISLQVHNERNLFFAL